MTTSIQIPPDAVQAVVAQAIMESITPEAREKILSDAIAGLLLTPPRTQSFGAQPEAPLKSAFDMAVRAAVNKEAHKMLDESPSAQKAIKDLVGAAIVDLCQDNYDGLPEAIGEAIGGWLEKRRH